MKLSKSDSMKKSFRHLGFTLIELMIAIAIVAILAALAIPAYNQYILEAKLTTMTQNINSMRIFLEDYRLENGSYDGPNVDVSAPPIETYNNVDSIFDDFV